MTEQEKHYQGVIAAIGRTMLIFFALLNVLSIVSVIFDSVVYSFPMSYAARVISSQLVYGACYMLSFMLPVLFLRMWIKRRKFQPQPMYFEVRWSPYLPLMILSGITICYATATVNQTLTSVFDIFAPAEELVSSGFASMEPYEIVLQFIVICVVPGFCEEFLFRGAILTNCLPFGRTSALIISSLLFAVMHQNFDQLLYTFMAGMVMGLIYERTGSIWPSTILHICNNFLSVISATVASKMGIGESGTLTLILIESAVFAVGTVSTVILIGRFFSQKNDLRDGVFGQSLPAADSYATEPIAPARARRLFCTPCMIIFFALCFLMMILRVVTMMLVAFIGG